MKMEVGLTINVNRCPRIRGGRARVGVIWGARRDGNGDRDRVRKFNK